MAYRQFLTKKNIMILLLGIFLVAVIAIRFAYKPGESAMAADSSPSALPVQAAVPPTAAAVIPPTRQEVLSQNDRNMDTSVSSQEEEEIEKQFELDRQDQKQTKELKIKLEQENLELEQQKVIAEINKLKKENIGSFGDSPFASTSPQSIPDVKVVYIGGDEAAKEAIVLIAGTSYQIKENSSPMDNVQVVSISDSNVKLHFNAQNMTRAFDFKPE